MARCAATREEEQAVSAATQGPCRLKVKDARPARKLSPWPVMALALASARPWPDVSAPQPRYLARSTWHVCGGRPAG